MESASTTIAQPLSGPVGPVPDLTQMLVLCSKRIAGTGAFGTVYRCSPAQYGEVAVKAITFDRSVDQAHRDEFERKMKRELGIWKRLDHPNIVPLLGTAEGGIFGSDHPCMVSMWMQHETLTEYVTGHEHNLLLLPSRIKLITGSAAGLEYLHSKSIVHGDFHPGNILIDGDHNPRLTDFGFSQTCSREKCLSYLFTKSVRPGLPMWVAPEVLYPYLFEDALEADIETDLHVDIYSLGSIILFILSGKFPWSKAEFETKSDELQNPPRPLWPVIPDVVWNVIEGCWSPGRPGRRPSAHQVLSFSRDRLQQLLQPNPESDINVVLFGPLGCGKSLILDLLAAEPIPTAPVSTNMDPCTEQPRCYQISIDERRFRLWDMTEFHLPPGRDTSHLSPYEQAHAVLRNIPGGVHLILLCARKNQIPSLGGLYWLINDFFFAGRAPVAFVVTHSDSSDKRYYQRSIAKVTRTVLVQAVEHAFRIIALTGDDQSRRMLKALLANAISSTPLRLHVSSHEAATRDIVAHCGLSNSDAAALVERFGRAPNVAENDREEARE